MQIELLWIIPIVAFAFFVFLLIFFAQKRSEQAYPDLANEVNRFNSGLVAKKPLESKPDGVGSGVSIDPAVGDMAGLGGSVNLIDRHTNLFLPAVEDLDGQDITAAVTIGQRTEIMLIKAIVFQNHSV